MATIKNNPDRMIARELIEKITEETGFSKKNTTLFLNTFIKVVKEEMKRKRQIYIRFFGYLTPIKVKEAKLKNNYTNGEQIIPEHTRYILQLTEFCKEEIGQLCQRRKS